MADWYVSSTAYTAVAQFAVNHAYTLGNIVRQLATPLVNSERCFICTTAGTSGATEASWSTTKAATTTQGTAVFTETTGNSTYAWSAPAARAALMTGVTFTAAGDRVFLSSDHAETSAQGNTFGSQKLTVISVNRAGSVPPVAADVLNGATLTTTGGAAITVSLAGSVNGVNFVNSAVTFTMSTATGLYMRNCTITGTGGSLSVSITGGSSFTLDNVGFAFTSTTTGITFSANNQFRWINTATPFLGSIPTTLFNTSTTGSVTLAGLDLSAVTGTLFSAPPTSGVIMNCKLAAGVTIAGAPGVMGPSLDLINCDSGNTNYRNERYHYSGNITTNTSITRVGGASDSTTAVSHVYTSSNPTLIPGASQLSGIPLTAWNAVLGSAKTATVCLVSSASLTDADVWMELEYLGTSGNPKSVFASSKTALLATPAALPTDTSTWNNPPSTPVYQKISCAFTAQSAGLIRAVLYVAKASTVLYVDPLITVT